MDGLLHFVIREHVPSLKNDRNLFVVKSKKTGKDVAMSVPTREVDTFIARTKSKFKAVAKVAPGEILIPHPGQAAYLVLFGVHSGTELSVKDGDNAATTIQEAMQGSLVKDDKQIVGGEWFKRMLKSKDNLFTEVYFWPTSGDLDQYIDEKTELLRGLKRC